MKICCVIMNKNPLFSLDEIFLLRLNLEIKIILIAQIDFLQILNESGR